MSSNIFAAWRLLVSLYRKAKNKAILSDKKETKNSKIGDYAQLKEGFAIARKSCLALLFFFLLISDVKEQKIRIFFVKPLDKPKKVCYSTGYKCDDRKQVAFHESFREPTAVQVGRRVTV